MKGRVEVPVMDVRLRWVWSKVFAKRERGVGGDITFDFCLDFFRGVKITKGENNYQSNPRCCYISTLCIYLYMLE